MAFVSVSEERSFSIIRRIKRWFSSTMRNDSLNNQMFKNIQKNLLDSINFQVIADNFAKARKALVNYWAYSKSHRKQFLQVKLTQIHCVIIAF